MKLILSGIIFFITTAASFGQDKDFYDIETKCGTFAERYDDGNLLLGSINDIVDSVREYGQQKAYTSPTSKFMVHYDTSGINAVSDADINDNGIPDYIDSVAYYFDYVYNQQVEIMNYKDPIIGDDGKGGSDAYDVYILDIGNGEDAFYGATKKENLIYPTREYPRYKSFIYIDNNYSEYDSSDTRSGQKKGTYFEYGITAMKITAAHEFFHAVQFMYGDMYPSPGLHEMFSIWMENRLFPESQDYFQFVDILLKNVWRISFGNAEDYTTGYYYGIFAEYLHKHHGDIFVKTFWENVYEGTNGYTILNQLLENEGSSLSESWCEFITWLYYTGSRAVPGQYLNNAEYFPELSYSSSDVYTEPSYMKNGKMGAFEINSYEMIADAGDLNTDDTISFIISNIDLDAAVMRSNTTRDYTLACVKGSNPGFERIEPTDYYHKLEADEDYFCSHYYAVRGSHSVPLTYAVPNPYIKSRHREIIFPIPQDVTFDNTVQLTIYNSEMQQMFQESVKPVFYKDYRGILYSELPAEISSGVYIFRISFNDKEIIGKFAVIDDK